MSYYNTIKSSSLSTLRQPKHSGHWKSISHANFPAEISQISAKSPNPGYIEIIGQNGEIAYAFPPISASNYTMCTPSCPRYTIGPFAKLTRSIEGLKVTNMFKKITRKLRLNKKPKSAKIDSGYSVESLDSKDEIEIMHFYQSFTPYTFSPSLQTSTTIEEFTTANEIFSPDHSLGQVSPSVIDQFVFPSSVPTLIPCKREWEWGGFICMDK